MSNAETNERTFQEELREAVRDAIRKEREECAKVADSWANDPGYDGMGSHWHSRETGRRIADSIRRRK